MRSTPRLYPFVTRQNVAFAMGRAVSTLDRWSAEPLFPAPAFTGGYCNRQKHYHLGEMQSYLQEHREATPQHLERLAKLATYAPLEAEEGQV